MATPTAATTPHNWRHHKFQLSLWQRELVLHRLEADDCLVDVFEERYTQAEVLDAVDYLMPRVKDGEIPAAMSEVERDVLADCLDGSTFIAAARGNVSEQQYGQMCARAALFAEKVSTWLCQHVDIPVT